MPWRTRTRLACAAIGAAGLLTAVSSLGSAAPRLGPHAQGGYTATAAYERLQQRSLELEALALRARDQAKIDERHGGSDDVTHRIHEFAEHAHQLAELMRKNDADQPKVNGRIRQLMDDAAKVQREWAKSKRRNPQTIAAWNRTLEVLTDVNTQYMAANGLAAPPEVAIGTSGVSDELDGTWGGSRETLLRDLASQAERAERLGRASSFGVASDLTELRRQVDAMSDPAGRMTVAESHERIVRLLFDAQQVQRRLNVDDAPADLRDQVNALVGLLVHMRNLTGERAAGTAGYEPPLPPGREIAAGDWSALMTELSQRTLRASELATDATLYELSGKLVNFRNKLQEYDRTASAMEPGDRRRRLDSLLREAQERQRDLAEHGAPLGLVSEWNTVVDLLVQLRNSA